MISFNFCPECGTASKGTKFCADCGAGLAPGRTGGEGDTETPVAETAKSAPELAAPSRIDDGAAPADSLKGASAVRAAVRDWDQQTRWVVAGTGVVCLIIGVLLVASATGGSGSTTPSAASPDSRVLSGAEAQSTWNSRCSEAISSEYPSLGVDYAETACSFVLTSRFGMYGANAKIVPGTTGSAIDGQVRENLNAIAELAAGTKQYREGTP